MKRAITWTLGSILFITILFNVPAHGQTLLSNRFDKMNDSTANAVATHQIGFIYQVTSQPVGSIVFEFCSNNPVPEDTCDLPAGFDATGASLADQTGNTGFSIHGNTTANRIVLTRAPTNPTAVDSTYTLEDIINPSDNGTHFVRLYTYSSTDGTGSPVEVGGIAIYINEDLQVGAEVPPSLRFCVGVTITGFDCSSADSFFIDFGYLSTTATRFATSQFMAGTNAEFGYTITVSGSTLTSGSNTITAPAAPTPSIPGASQFAFNLRANTAPLVGDDVVGPGLAQPDPKYATPNQYAFNNGDILASVTHSDDNRKYTVSYVTNIDGSEPGGVYATTLSFICLGNF